MTSKISIIIPTYDEEKYIEKCLESLNEQIYKNFEVIVVDDGSNDRTLEILRKFKKIKLIEGNHKGPGFSRNLGAKYARGEILIFVDADMFFDRYYIKNLIKPILNNKSGNIIGTTHELEIAKNTENWISDLWGEIRVSKEQAKEVKIFRAIRKNKFLELGGFDSKYGYADDQTFWFKHKLKPEVAEGTICYHRNPETLNETYKQAKWIGASWKQRYKTFRIPLLSHLISICFYILVPVIALAKSIKIKKDIKFIQKYRFYLAKFYGYGAGIIKVVYLGDNVK